jgi:hypothetical protein
MGCPMAKITKRSVDAAGPGDKEFFIWDEEQKGFSLRVYPTGRKMYLAQFRAGGRLRRVKIGLHGALTPDAARRALCPTQNRSDQGRGRQSWPR